MAMCFATLGLVAPGIKIETGPEYAGKEGNQWRTAGIRNMASLTR